MGALAVRVRERSAEGTRRLLASRGYLDEERMMVRSQGFVELPVVSPPQFMDFVVVEQAKPVYKRPKLSHALIKRELKLRGKAADALRHYEFLGDVLVVSLPDGTDKKKIGEGLLRIIPRARAVVNVRRISGEFREPEAELIAGSTAETLHREHGCVFKLDPTKVMFSSGNKEERLRMALISNEEEVVLDMFAGVGQFSVPLAKYSRPRKVIAVEKNPIAFSYLAANAKLNGLDNMEPALGDCAKVSPKRAVDRVIMGHFNSEKYLGVAAEAIRSRGTIHCHCIVPKLGLEEKTADVVAKLRTMGYEVEDAEGRIVKSYAPGLEHAVLDLRLVE